jgi:hypothetical protein
LNDVLAVCKTVYDGVDGKTVEFGEMSCQNTVFNSETYATIVDAAGVDSCKETANAINQAIREHRGPAGADEAVSCGFNKFFVDAVDCQGV